MKMGSTELALLLKYGVPLVIRLLADGKNSEYVEEVVSCAITGVATSDIEVRDALINADGKQTQSIIASLFGVITGATDALGGLVCALGGLMGSKKK